jgi:predicted metal-dependent peptidase
MEQNSGERLKNLIAKFVLKYNYWGYLFSRIRRKAGKNFGSIMGVVAEPDGTVSLQYEPELVSQTDDKEILKIVEHEGMHLLNKHLPRLLRILANEVSDHRKILKIKAWNIAADCSVNVQANIREPIIIAGKPWPPHLPAMHNLEEGKITEEYFLTLLERHDKGVQQLRDLICGDCPKNPDNQKGQGQSGQGEGEQTPQQGQGEGGDPKEGQGQSGQGQSGQGGGEGQDKCPGLGSAGCPKCGGLDNHKHWTEGTGSIPDLSALSRKIDQHVANIVKESVKSFNKDRGNIPAHIAQLIESALAPPKAPYYQIIRKLVRGSRFSKFRRSPTKINRKRTYVFSMQDNKCIPQISPFPGKTRDMTFDIVVLIDTSGSMSPDDILEGLSGVKNIIEKDRHCYTTVLEVDAAVEKEYTVKKLRDIQFDIKGRGGTTLYPGLERARQLNPDVCLAFTDGYTENINNIARKKLPKKLIWVITPDGSADNVNKTGFVVRI